MRLCKRASVHPPIAIGWPVGFSLVERLTGWKLPFCSFVRLGCLFFPMLPTYHVNIDGLPQELTVSSASDKSATTASVPGPRLADHHPPPRFSNPAWPTRATHTHTLTPNPLTLRRWMGGMEVAVLKIIQACPLAPFKDQGSHGTASIKDVKWFSNRASC